MKLTDTQLSLLSAASQRDDRALERPPNLTGGTAGKVVAKLLAEGLIEEAQSRGSLPSGGATTTARVLCELPREPSNRQRSRPLHQ